MKWTKLTLTLLTFTTVVPLLIAGMLLRGADNAGGSQFVNR
jgi:hypothetical protein